LRNSYFKISRIATIYIIYLINGNVTLDNNNRTISYNGEELQLKNIDDECLRLYVKIEDFIEKKPLINYKRTRDVHPYDPTITDDEF
jgi:hypothetical protein